MATNSTLSSAISPTRKLVLIWKNSRTSRIEMETDNAKI